MLAPDYEVYVALANHDPPPPTPLRAINMQRCGGECCSAGVPEARGPLLSSVAHSY